VRRAGVGAKTKRAPGEPAKAATRGVNGPDQAPPAAPRERLAAKARALPAAQRERATTKSKDQARTLALLWGAQERGSRSGLTVEAIVRAAVEMADQEGFESVSMRRLADVLEVGTMSLYTHVPGKAELTDLMIDSVYGELYENVEEAQNAEGGYRAGLCMIAERNRALYARHPWLLDVPLTRPVLGPHACLKYEAELRVLDGIGLSDLEIDSMVSMLMMHVQGASRASVSEQRAQQTSGLTEMEWWAATLPLLERVMRGQFAVASRVGQAAGEAIQPATTPEHMYHFGLEVICETVASMVARNTLASHVGRKF
jgi:AcrR family transcriptional regulator